MSENHTSPSASTQALDRLSAYVGGGYHAVEGWTQPSAFAAVGAIADFQRSAGIRGGACEIGVHHGRFFINLLMATPPGMRSLAIDIFDNHDDNIDGSGVGSSSEIFQNNVVGHTDRMSDVAMWSRDSFSLNSNDVQIALKEFGLFSIFSVDGGHTAEHTINDLRFAEATTNSAGVIFIDDYYNSHWPGVHLGVTKYFFTGCPKFVPFAYVRDKLLLTTLTWHKRYFDHFVSLSGVWTDLKVVKMFGYDVLAFVFHG